MPSLQPNREGQAKEAKEGNLESHQSFWLTDAEVELLNDVPVVGSEVQRVGNEGDFPGVDRDQCECHVGKRFDGYLMLRVSSVPLSVALELPLLSMS